MDDAAAAVEETETAQRKLVRVAVSMRADSAWRAAGATSFQSWARTYTALSDGEARRLERISQLCFMHPALAEAVYSGQLSLGRIRRLARWATRDRQPFLTEPIVATLLEVNANTPGDDEAWGRAVAFWAEQVDQELAVSPEHQQRLYLTERLFGGGDILGSLAPVAFETVAASLEAFTQDPDPSDAPYQRSLAERRADALEDLALFGLTHSDEDSIHPTDDDNDDEDDWGWDDPCDPSEADDDTDFSDDFDGDGPNPPAAASDDAGSAASVTSVSGADTGLSDDQDDHDEDEPKDGSGRGRSTGGRSAAGREWRPFDEPDSDAADDPDVADDLNRNDDVDEGVYDGMCDHDVLDELLDDLRHGGSGVDPLEALRRVTARKVTARRRRARRTVKPRSGVTVNVHMDIRTMAGRDFGDLDGLVLRSDIWDIAERAARQMLCDSAMVATLFNGPGHVLDANDSAEQFNRAQRRAIAARDKHCVFPSCRRPPRFCDCHHLDHREHGGPTKVDNGCLLCRYHHRLIHQYGWKLEVINGRWIATDPHDKAWIGEPRPQGPPDDADSQPPTSTAYGSDSSTPDADAPAATTTEPIAAPMRC